jgi:N-ethylmaleimide reductase
MPISIFEPLKLGKQTFKNRIFMAPMTRSRATPEGVHHELASLYYAQRAGAGLIISEATAVCKQGSGYPVIPGLFTDAQEASLKPITQAVHEKNGKIFIQLFHTGRVSHSSLTEEKPVAPSPLALPDKVSTSTFSQVEAEVPRALDNKRIVGVVQAFAEAAKRAVRAGADGIELHAANGYLLDQFLRDGTNQRTDSYGGSIENRLRLLRETTTSVCRAIGADRLGVRISPFGNFNGMKDSNPKALFTAVAKMLSSFGLAYLHVMEAPSGTSTEVEENITADLKEAFAGPIIVNFKYDLPRATKIVAAGLADAVAFGVPFLANPDLVERFRRGTPLNTADPTTFYGGGAKGYTDYPTLT